MSLSVCQIWCFYHKSHNSVIFLLQSAGLLAHLSDTRKLHNGHTRLDTKVLEGTRSLNLYFILNWNAKRTRTEREGNANGTGRKRFKNAFSAAFSVRFLLSGTVSHKPVYAYRSNIQLRIISL